MFMCMETLWITAIYLLLSIADMVCMSCTYVETIECMSSTGSV